MPNITFTLSAQDIDRLTAAFGNNYQELINGQPNSESQAQFTKRMVGEFIKKHVRSYERRDAVALAIQEAESGITDITIT